MPAEKSSHDSETRAKNVLNIHDRWNVKQGLQLKGLRSKRLSISGKRTDHTSPQ